MSITIQVHPDEYEVTLFPKDPRGDSFAVVKAFEDRASVSLFLPDAAACDELIRAAVEAKRLLSPPEPPEPPDPDACTCGHLAAQHIYGGRCPCTQCGCKAFAAPVTDEAVAAPAAKAIETGTPVIVEDDKPGPYDQAIQQARFFAQPGNTIDDILAAAPAPAPSVRWCTSGHEPTPGVKVLCELRAGHPGEDHRAPGLEEGDPDITWTDAPDLLDALLAAGHKVTYSEDTAVGGWWANLIRPDGSFAENGLGETQEQALAQLRERVARQESRA